MRSTHPEAGKGTKSATLLCVSFGGVGPRRPLAAEIESPIKCQNEGEGEGGGRGLCASLAGFWGSGVCEACVGRHWIGPGDGVQDSL